MKRDYDVKILEKQYKKGDLVYVLDTANIKGKCKKLSPPWKGPGIVLERLTPYIYKIKLQSFLQPIMTVSKHVGTERYLFGFRNVRLS